MSAIDPNTAYYGPENDLERQQYEALYHELDVPLQDIRKQHYTPILILCSLLLVLVLLMASLVQIPNYLQVEVHMENQKKDQVVFFQHAATVKEYLVEVGDEVKAGQEICRVGAPQIQSLIADIQAAEHEIKVLDLYDAQNVKQRVEHLRNEKQIRKHRIEALKAEKQASVSLYEGQKHALNAEREYRKKLLDKDLYLFEKGAISEVEYLATERNYLDKVDQLALLDKKHRQGLEQFKQRKVALTETVLSLTHQSEELIRAYDTDRNKLKEQIDLAKQNLQLYYGPYNIEEEDLVLLAPHEGSISYIYPDQQLLQAGEILFRLESGEKKFVAKGMIAANRIGYVKQDMPAKIMLETFPHYEWGSLSGKVYKVSASPGEQGTFSIQVDITQEHPLISPVLQNGQTGTCSLIIEQKTLFGYAFRRVKKNLSEVLY